MRINPQLEEKIQESMAAVLPITAIVLVLFFFGAILLVCGMGFFTLGVDMSMIPMGDGIGATITYKTDLKKGDRNMNNEHRGENSLILITCNRGASDSIMETAKKAGARGGTVLRARWSGQEELERSYGLTLTPEKEILIIVVPNEIRNAVMESVNAQHGLRSSSEALVCSLAVDRFVRL